MKLSLVCLTCALAAGTPFVAVGTDSETFVTDGLGIDWFGYRSNTAKTVFTYENGKTTMTNLDSDSYVWGYLPEEISLEIGDSVTFSGTATFNSVASSGSFYIGLYNSGANTKPASGTTFSSIVAGTYGMTGFFGGTGKKSSGTTTQVFSRFSEKAPNASGSGGAGFMTSNQGSSYIASATPEGMLNHPVANTDYEFALTILRTANGYDVSVGNAGTVSFSAEKSFSSGVFDVIAMKSPGSGITLSNLSVATTGAVIPEPSSLAWLLGIFSGVLIASARRTRGKDK
ncbi:MAG: hypothetical protein IJN19_02735 [Opitutales bacterium]|nr:hypothetical protein [Opitutales bacterium]